MRKDNNVYFYNKENIKKNYTKQQIVRLIDCMEPVQGAVIVVIHPRRRA